jgi:hypothetical protein
MNHYVRSLNATATCGVFRVAAAFLIERSVIFKEILTVRKISGPAAITQSVGNPASTGTYITATLRKVLSLLLCLKVAELKEFATATTWTRSIAMAGGRSRILFHPSEVVFFFVVFGVGVSAVFDLRSF